jgi:hypothetical protein
MSVSHDRPARPRRRWIWAIVALVTATALISPLALLVGLKPAPHHEYGPVTVPPGTRYRIDTGPGNAVRVSPGMCSPDAVGLIASEAGSGTLTIGYRA